MNNHISRSNSTSSHRKTSRVRLLDDEHHVHSSGRRSFLRKLAAQGVSIPAAYFMLGNVPDVRAAASKSGGHRKHGAGLDAGTAAPKSAQTRIVRDFSDPYIELIRLLREASEIEHGLMCQYLYAAFSLKPIYSSIAGHGAPNADDLLGVAIQEMQHLGSVNELLVALGAAPNLVRQDFPYEPDIYPFKFDLEPLSRSSLAKYVYCEAPPDTFDGVRHDSAPDRAFLDQVHEVLGPNIRPNYIGSLYGAVIDTLQEILTSSDPNVVALKPWTGKLEAIQLEGEVDHFEFFKQLFMGTHKGFNGHPDVWGLERDDPAYPALELPVNPSAYVGHENQIENAQALSTAWLANLHYWAVLLLLDLGYREASPEYLGLAKLHMIGPFWSLARHLPTMGVGMPFDPLSMGYAPGQSGPHSLNLIERMLGEADRLTRELEGQLPGDFPVSVSRTTVEQLRAKRLQYASN